MTNNRIHNGLTKLVAFVIITHSIGLLWAVPAVEAANAIGADIKRPTITIVAPAKGSDFTTKKTIIRVRDNKAIQSSKVTIDLSTTAGTSDFKCSQVSVIRVNCTVKITMSGVLKIKAVDEAGNTSIKSRGSFVIKAVAKQASKTVTVSSPISASEMPTQDVPRATDPVTNDTTAPAIEIIDPSQRPDSTLTETTIRVTDDMSISASDVMIEDNLSSASTTNFVCSQVSKNRVDCTARVIGRGYLYIKAVDSKGNATSESGFTYVLNVNEPISITAYKVPMICDPREAIKSGNYDEISPSLSPEDFPAAADCKDGETVEISLFEFHPDSYSNGAKAGIKKYGYRDATALELLALGAAQPNLQRQYTIISLGTSIWNPLGDTNVIGFGEGYYGGNILSLNWMDPDCTNALLRHAAVRK